MYNSQRFRLFPIKRVQKQSDRTYHHHCMLLLNRIVQFVALTSLKNGIDESHGLSHSMNTLYYANQIYKSEAMFKPYLAQQENIIYVASLIHDLCDKKYTNQPEQQIQEIVEFLNKTHCLDHPEIEVITKIISTCSYSYVLKHGFPDLGKYQTAYHIVREADLLCSYDVDRCLLYQIYCKKSDLREAFQNTNLYFQTKMFRLQKDNRFFTHFAKEECKKKQEEAMNRLWFWKTMIEHSAFQSNRSNLRDPF